MKTEQRNQQVIAGAEGLLAGDVWCVPTDTVYGLCAVPSFLGAVARIFALKGRDLSAPLALLAYAPEDAAECVVRNEAMERCYARFAPGGLTFVLPKHPRLRESAPHLNPGTETQAVRFPGPSCAQELLRLLRRPIVATSVNPSGKREALSSAEARAYFPGVPVLGEEGWPKPTGRASTILDLSARPYRLLREGAVGRGEIEEALGEALG
jgi:L-threonylcarbamoyladenylate synthase